MTNELGVAGTIETRITSIQVLNDWIRCNPDVEIIDIRVIDSHQVLLIIRKEVN